MTMLLRILNLEDDANDAELNHAMLSARWPNCELARVDTEPEFVTALKQGNLDLILSDYTIPGFNGREALNLARSLRPEVPFLFVSGTIGEDTAIEALKCGATDYVLKHRLMRLIPAVDRALREAADRAAHRRAEEAMRQSEYKYRELFECLGDAAFLADVESDKVIDTNRSAQTMLGYSRAEILGRKQSQFLVLNGDPPPADAPVPIVSQGRLVRADGNSFAAEVRTTPLTLYGRALALRLCHKLGE